jgi:hypothetical protein
MWVYRPNDCTLQHQKIIPYLSFLSHYFLTNLHTPSKISPLIWKFGYSEASYVTDGGRLEVQSKQEHFILVGLNIIYERSRNFKDLSLQQEERMKIFGEVEGL